MMIDEMIEKEEISIGKDKFLISKIPAIQAQEIYGNVVRATEGVGDIGMTFLPLAVSKRLLAYTAYKAGDEWLSLDEDGRFGDAFKDLFSLIKLEAAMIRKNFGFLFDGSLPDVLEYLRGESREQAE